MPSARPSARLARVVGGARHRRQHQWPPCALRRAAAGPRAQSRQRLGRHGPRGIDQRVGRQKLLRLARHRAVDVRRRCAGPPPRRRRCRCTGREQQPAPRRAQLAPRHLDDEVHLLALHPSASTRRRLRGRQHRGRRRRGALLSSAVVAVAHHATSRREMRRSTSAARSWSCVTRTSVAPRRRFISIIRSKTWRPCASRGCRSARRRGGWRGRWRRRGRWPRALLAARELRRVVVSARRQVNSSSRRRASRRRRACPQSQSARARSRTPGATG